jgi:hypothetical protein
MAVGLAALAVVVDELMSGFKSKCLLNLVHISDT